MSRDTNIHVYLVSVTITTLILFFYGHYCECRPSWIYADYPIFGSPMLSYFECAIQGIIPNDIKTEKLLLQFVICQSVYTGIKTVPFP